MLADVTIPNDKYTVPLEEYLRAVASMNDEIGPLDKEYVGDALRMAADAIEAMKTIQPLHGEADSMENQRDEAFEQREESLQSINSRPHLWQEDHRA